MDPVLERLLKRDRLLVSACLAIVVLLATCYLVSGAGMGMTALQMTESMRHMGADTGSAWSAAQALSMFLMWWVMMIAMMLPSAAPVILLSAAVNRRAQSAQPPYGDTVAFVLGYLSLWAVFSVCATAAQYWLQRAGMLSMHLESVNTALTGALLVTAGLWQFTPLKDACLRHCRSPVVFLARFRRPGVAGALAMGARHGLYCLGCCWFLMALLFVGGVMNLYWIIGLAAYVFAEKVLLVGRLPGWLAGLALLCAGVAVIAG